MNCGACGLRCEPFDRFTSPPEGCNPLRLLLAPMVPPRKACSPSVTAGPLATSAAGPLAFRSIDVANNEEPEGGGEDGLGRVAADTARGNTGGGAQRMPMRFRNSCAITSFGSGAGAAGTSITSRTHLNSFSSQRKTSATKASPGRGSGATSTGGAPSPFSGATVNLPAGNGASASSLQRWCVSCFTWMAGAPRRFLTQECGVQPLLVPLQSTLPGLCSCPVAASKRSLSRTWST
mmetsp:Transcript_101631/g.217617  ORF Transcript_101631/g.217617 Transcript_101631/m.217617 type:complete len:235 (-) Transcript_101631:706-1410(-)